MKSLSEYSQLGKKLLSECIEKHGYAILYECGVTNKTLKRMIKKGLTGREVDLMISLLSLEKVASVYIKRREFELLKKIFSRALELFSKKMVMLLSLKILYSVITKSFFDNKTYEQIFFSATNRIERYYLDRTYFFDPIVFFICELYKAQQVLDDDKLTELFNTCLMSTNKLALLANRLPKKSKAKLNLKPIGSKKDITGPTIRKEIISLYDIVKTAFTDNGIDNIQKHCIHNTGRYTFKIKELVYHNFAMHRDKKIPNLLLAQFRQTCLSLKNRKQQY